MANMSYAKYHNVAIDLEEVVDGWNHKVDQLSEGDLASRRQILDLAMTLVHAAQRAGVVDTDLVRSPKEGAESVILEELDGE